MYALSTCAPLPFDCVQVLVRGSEGVSTALQALARARHTLLKLYQQDCVVYMAWKTPQPPAAGAAGDAAAAAGGDAGDTAAAGAAGDGAAAGHSGQVSGASSSCASTHQAQQQQQSECMPPEAADGDNEGAGSTGTEAGAVQQPAVQVVLPQRLYKLVIMACDPADPLSGWRHLSPHTKRSRRAEQQQQAWLAEAQARQQERQAQRQAQTRLKRRLRWFRPRRNCGASQDSQPP